MTDTLNKKTIAVIGAGGWGTAIAQLLCGNGHRVMLWSKFQREIDVLKATGENNEFLPGVKLNEKLEFTTDLNCITEADIVFMVLPSKVVSQVSIEMAEYVKDGQIIVILSKGFEESELLTLSQVIGKNIPQSKICVMSGPSHAEEVARQIPTLNVVASKYEECAKTVQDICMNDFFRIYTSDDVLGVELGGALKNVIALCAGIIDGIGFGDNTKAALMTRGIKEISRLGIKMGANPDTFWGLSGIGDLIVTCTSMHSRNRRAGILIGKGYTVEQAIDEVHMVVEGISNAKAAYALAKKYEVQMPIIESAYDVLYAGKNPKDAVTDLMLRNKKIENL